MLHLIRIESRLFGYVSKCICKANVTTSHFTVKPIFSEVKRLAQGHTSIIDKIRVSISHSCQRKLLVLHFLESSKFILHKKRDEIQLLISKDSCGLLITFVHCQLRANLAKGSSALSEMSAAEYEDRAHKTPAFVGMGVASLEELFAFRNIWYWKNILWKEKFRLFYKNISFSVTFHRCKSMQTFFKICFQIYVTQFPAFHLLYTNYWAILSD